MKRFVWFAAIVVLASCRPAEVGAVAISGQTNATNSPLTSPVTGETAVADVAQLIPPNQFLNVNAELAKTLVAQGFTAKNNWVYAFVGLPMGINNPVGMPGNADFNVTAYNLFMNGAKTAFGETMDFTLKNPPANPAVPAGAVITSHWLQLVNTSSQVNGYGYALAGEQGFWQLDNGQKDWAAGVGPFYDSNAPAGAFSVPPTYHDAPQFYSGTGTYLHFITIPSWDVSLNGKDYLLIGNAGIEWGFSISPEPSTFALAGCFAVLLAIVAWVRRARAGLHGA
jgi:hypothetical protein